jgi:hypothetical protein
MSSEQLADGVNPLDAELAATWDVLKGYSGRDTDLGIARRFGGSAAAYSLRDIGAMNGRVVKVRRDLAGEEADPEEDFSANQVSSGALENWVNGKLESTLPVDVDPTNAKAGYSLRKVKKTYSGNAVRIRRSSDDAEVNVAFDSDSKVSSSSSISTVTGSTTATDLDGFLNESVSGFTSVPYSGIDASYKNFTSDPTISDTAFSGTNGGTPSRLVYLNTTDAFVTASDFDGCKVKVTGTVNTLSGGDLIIKPATSNNGGGTWTPSEGEKVISDGTTGSFEYIFTGNGTNGFRSVIFLVDASTTVNVSNLTFEYIEHGATVHTWYDQAVSNNAVQDTAANQPKIAENGALLADGLLFDGSDDVLVSTSFSATQPITTSAVFKSSNTSDSQTVIGGVSYNYIIHRAGGAATAGLNAGTLYAPFSSITTKQLMTTLANGASSTVAQNGVISSAGNAGTNNQTDLGIGSNGNGGTAGSGSAKFDGSIEEVIVYDSDQSNNRFKIESNINNYYGLYNDENEADGVWIAASGSLTGVDTITGYDGTGSAERLSFRATSTGGNKTCGLILNKALASGDDLFVSFNLKINSGTPSITIRSSSTTTTEIVAEDFVTLVEGFNSYQFNIDTAASAPFLAVQDSEAFDVQLKDLKVSRIARNGFVETWYDQSGNGFHMTQTTASIQPYIIQNGGSHNGVFAPRNLATSGSKIHLESLFRNQNFPANTSKVAYIVVGENITAQGNGNDKGTIFGSFRGVANYTGGQLGLVVESTNKLGLYNGLANANLVQKVDLTTSGDNAIQTNKVIMVASANNRSVTLFSNDQTTTGDFVRNTGGNEDLNLDDSVAEAASRNYLQIFAPNRDGAPRPQNYSYGTVRECILLAGDSAVDDLTDFRNDLNNHYQYY